MNGDSGREAADGLEDMSVSLDFCSLSARGGQLPQAEKIRKLVSKIDAAATFFPITVARRFGAILAPAQLARR
jgi:hypothetical protein